MTTGHQCFALSCCSKSEVIWEDFPKRAIQGYSDIPFWELFLKGKAHTVDLLVKTACFVKKNKISIKAPNLNYLGQGGQPY